MKKFITFLGVLAFVVSCEPIEEAPKYLEINGESADLTIGTIDDNGTNSSITYREYVLTFASSDTKPSDYIRFTLYSTSTSRLEEGTYNYEYLGYGAGDFSWLKVGKDIQYDNSGVAISGTRINESDYDYEGTVTVSMEDDLYKFVFDLTGVDGDVSYTVMGEFSDLLKEQYISIE
jgi:hypothetical protein